MVIPSSTVEVERGFSLLNNTKSELRNRFIQDNLLHLINIMINGPSKIEDLNQKKIIEVFLSRKERKFNHSLSQDLDIGRDTGDQNDEDPDSAEQGFIAEGDYVHDDLEKE